MALTPRQRTVLKWLLEMRRTLALSFPIMAGMIGHMLLGLTDTMMVGRVGVSALASAALVNTVSHIPVVFAFGLLASVQILTSQAFGARQPVEAGETFRHGLLMAALAGLATAVGLVLTGPYLTLLGQPAEVVAGCQVYLHYIAWSMLPALVTHAAKQFSESLNQPWLPMVIVLGGVGLNIFLNWVFIFGNLGADAMGLEGAGLATLLARLATVTVMLWLVLRSARTRAWLPAEWLRNWSWRRLRGQVQLGFPVGLQTLMEVGGFSLGALMMGWISAAAMAAHQVAITCAATTFMFALGVGMGVSIRVGHAWGAGLPSRLKRIAYGGTFMGAGAMGLFALVFMLGGEVIAGWFVLDAEVIRLAAALLFVAGIFQVVDGTQVVMISALRGMSDVRLPLIIVAISYWALALPLAYVLAFVFGQGAVGIWIGLATGLAAAAFGLTARFHWRSGEAAMRKPPEEAPAIAPALP
jgi:multidrug resistance protein, MATE family